MKLEHLLGAFTRNWPLKLISLALALMVFFAVRFSNTPLRRDQVVYAYPAATAQGYPAGRQTAAVIAVPAGQEMDAVARTNGSETVKSKVSSAVDAIKKAVVPSKPPPAVVIVAPPPPVATNVPAVSAAVGTNAVAAPAVVATNVNSTAKEAVAGSKGPVDAASGR